MSRYIDIEPYEKDGWYLQKRYRNEHCEVVKTTPLVSVPTAEPVVRCKDCNKHSNENELHEVWCEAYEAVKSENGYCDLGERMESSND